MKSNTKSSVTLPLEEIRLIRQLKSRLKLKTNVEVVRAGLSLLKETTDRELIREEFRKASRVTQESLRHELDELDHLSSEGL